MRCTIAIDGPAASGKSSAAEAIARRLKFSRLDSGLLYRAITHVLSQEFPDLDLDDESVAGRVANLEIEMKDGKIVHGGEDITAHLRTPAIDRLVGGVAKRLYIRQRVHSLQKQIISEPGEGLVIDGRDIGTVVVPNAFLKVFITAKDTTRAMRRAKQVGARYEEVLRDIQERDFQDINREHDPLRIAEDAHVIENDDITLEDTIEMVIRLFEERRSGGTRADLPETVWGESPKDASAGQK